MQYLVVDAPAAPWSDEAISFRAELASKADLATVVRKQPDVPQQSRLLLRDADSMWVSWENADELPQNGVLCVKVVKPGAQGWAMLLWLILASPTMLCISTKL